MTDSKFIDSSVWFGYFIDSSFKEIIENYDINLFTSVLSLFEVKLKLLKEIHKNKNNKDLFVQEQKINLVLGFIKKRSFIIPINEEIANDAAEISIKNKIAAIDSLIYASAIKNKTILVTLDNDFRGLDNVTILS